MKWILLVVAVVCAAASAAAFSRSLQPQSDEQALLAVVDRFMLAVSAEDSAAKMSEIRLEGYNIVERPDPSGGTVVTRRAFTPRPDAPRPAAAPTGRERYWDPVVHVRGSIAMVWTPYEFWTAGKTSHCGIDVFELMKDGGAWKIANVMYTVEPSSCETLRPKDPSRIRPAL